MGKILIVVGCIWFVLAAVFVLSLMCAAARRMPRPHPGRTRRTSPTLYPQRSAPVKVPAAEQNEIDPVLDA